MTIRNILATVAQWLAEPSNDRSELPTVLGFANLAGADFDAMISEDLAILSPTLPCIRSQAAHEIPKAQILFVYAHLNTDGTISGSSVSSIGEIIEMTKAAIVIVASPNSADSLRNAASLPRPKIANIVFTLDRKGTSFARFFHNLFGLMQNGHDMLLAWVKLAPQHASVMPSDVPDTVLLPDAGKVRFE